MHVEWIQDSDSGIHSLIHLSENGEAGLVKIRERVRSRNNQQRKAAAIEAYKKQYAEELNRIRLYERDGLRRSDSVEDVIDKEYDTYAKITEKYMDHIRPENSEEEKEEEQDPGEVFWEQWAYDMIRDRHTNVLAQLYFSELASVGAKLLEPEEFSETTCGRALLRFWPTPPREAICSWVATKRMIVVLDCQQSLMHVAPLQTIF